MTSTIFKSSAFKKQEYYSDSETEESDCEIDTSQNQTFPEITDFSRGFSSISPVNDIKIDMGYQNNDTQVCPSSSPIEEESSADFKLDKIVSDLECSDKKGMTRKAIKHREKLMKNAKKTGTPNQSIQLDSLPYIRKDEMLDEFDSVRVHIRSVQRNSRKSITTIEGIPERVFNDPTRLSELLEKLQKGIATRATHKFDAESKQHIIETSGNRLSIMAKIISEELGCSIDDIVTHGLSS